MLALSGTETRNEDGIDHDLSVLGTFFAVTGDGVEAVQIFLDERLRWQLSHGESACWRELIELVEQDLQR